MNPLWIAAATGLLLVAVVAHEAGHALVLRRLGVPIEAAGIGLPIQPMITIRPRGRRTYTLTLSIWLIGAYVTPDRRYEPHLERLPYRDKAWYAGAGIVTNILLAGILATLVTLNDPTGQWSASTFAVATVLTWIFRRPLCSYIFPIIGVPLLAAISIGTVRSLLQQDPIGMVGIAHELGRATTSTQALWIGALISIALAAANVIPIFPFDGGRIADAVIHDLWGATPAAWFRRITGGFAVALIAYCLGSDIMWAAT